MHCSTVGSNVLSVLGEHTYINFVLLVTHSFPILNLPHVIFFTRYQPLLFCLIGCWV